MQPIFYVFVNYLNRFPLCLFFLIFLFLFLCFLILRLPTLFFLFLCFLILCLPTLFFLAKTGLPMKPEGLALAAGSRVSQCRWAESMRGPHNQSEPAMLTFTWATLKMLMGTMWSSLFFSSTKSSHIVTKSSFWLFCYHQTLSAFPRHWPLGILPLKGGHGIFSMYNAQSAQA